MAAGEKKSIDKATLKMIEKAAIDGCETAFDRAEAQSPCAIGAVGSCCKHCAMGPCRMISFGVGQEPVTGICGATAETISARNFLRMIASGTAAHSDHGRGVAELLVATAKGEAPGYEIKDEQKLLQLALDWGIEIGERSNEEIAVDVGEKALAEFGKQKGELLFLRRGPL